MSWAVDVVVVNFNAGQALTRCIRSVLEQGPGTQLTIVDNASTDGSLQSLQNEFSLEKRVRVIESRENPGFATAVNRAAQTIRAGHSLASPAAPLLLILNPDCEMQAGALDRLCEALEAHPEAALAAPLLIGPNGETLKGTYRRFPDPWRSFVSFSGLWRLQRRIPLLEGVDQSDRLPAGTTQAEAVSGACMLIRKEPFFELGGMDGAYGLHCEDLDLMYRLHQSGRGCLLVPGASVYHDQGLSSRSRPLWVHWQKHLGMQRFFRKFQAERYVLPLRWMVITGIWARFVLTSPRVLLQR